jgi:hypothetical protein
MSAVRTKRLLQFGLPIAGFVIALLCGRSPSGAVGMVLLTAFMVFILAADPFSLVSPIFFSVLGLYGLKMGSKDEPEMDLKDPDTMLFLALGAPATLAIVGLLSFYFPVK